MTTIVARYCQKKLSSSNPCRGIECKEPTKIFIYGSKKQEKSVAMATTVAWQQLLPGIAEKLISSNLCRVMEGKEPHKIIYKSKKQKKSVAMAIIVARYCRKTSQLQSVQGFGMQRTHKNVYI